MHTSIIGGGPAGLYFAILAKKNFPDWEIHVYERNGPNDTFGWGVVFSDRT
ncbi:MAG: NAD(P)-binding protein, partial [Ignavibacteriota bacterium]